MGLGDRSLAHPDGANASCEDKGDRPETCDTLAGLGAGGTKRIAPRPREMTNEPRGHVFCEAAPFRADKPHGGNDCSRAYHGPGHEIVKKPFAPPSGGDQTSRPARGGATESNCPKFCWLDLTAAICGKYRAAEFRSYLLTYRSKSAGASAGSAIHRKIRGEMSRNRRLSDKLTMR